MKRILLSATLLASSMLGLAQVEPADYASAPIPKGLNDTVNTYFVVQHTKETKVNKYTVDFNTAKTLNYSSIYALNVLNSEISVAFDRTQEPNVSHYNEFYLYWATWGKKQNIKPTSIPFSYYLKGDQYLANQSQDTLIGTFLDLVANPAVTIVGKATAKTNVTVLLIDKNGRMSNLVCPKRWLKGGTEWETIEFRFDQKKADGTPDWEYTGTVNDDNVGIAADGWMQNWLDVATGRGYPVALPCNGRVNYNGAVMIDLHNIIGIGFRFDDGTITKDYSLETNKTIQIQSIILGGEPKYNGAPVPTGLNDTVNKYYTVTNTIGTKVQGVELVSKSADVHWYENKPQYGISDNVNTKDIVFNLQSTSNYNTFSAYCAHWGVKKSRNPHGGKPFTYQLDAAAWANTQVQFNAIPQTQQDTLIGTFVNFKENPVVTMVVEATERTNVWLNIIDKNGRVSNLISPAHWIEKGTTQTIEFRYDQKKIDGTPDWLCGYTIKRINNNVGIAADGYSGYWWNVDIGRESAVKPIVYGRKDRAGAVLLDLENIVGVELLFDAQNFSSEYNLATSKTISIKSLIIGKAVLSAPVEIIGDVSICLGTTKTYKWNRVKDAISYNLSYTGTGATIVVTDTSATVAFANDATAGNFELTAQAGTIISTQVLKTISIKAKPTKPTISGKTTICQNSKSAEYAIQAVASDETISWIASKNTSFSNGQGTATVTANFADTITQGYIAVEVSNACGLVSDKKTLNVSLLPVLTAKIIGKDTVCKNTKQELYALSENTASEYIWAIGGKTLTATKDTALIDFALTNAVISVKATNECGTSAAINKTIVVQSAYPEPIGLVTFSKDGKAMQVAWEHTKDVGTTQYKLLRETTSLGVWEPVSIVPYEKPGLYTDEDVNIDEKRYRYKLRTISTCGDSAESAPHRNMLLQSSYNVGTKKVNLFWGAYEGINVPTYIVYRVYGDGRADEVVNRYTGNETMAYDQFPVPNTSYRIAFKLLQDVDPLFYHLKSDTGPFSQSLSNMAEANLVGENETAIGQIAILPNPASDKIRVTGITSEVERLEIVNSLGETVYTLMQINSSEVEIAIDGFVKGIYNLRMLNADKIETLKFIKQ